MNNVVIDEGRVKGIVWFVSGLVMAAMFFSDQGRGYEVFGACFLAVGLYIFSWAFPSMRQVYKEHREHNRRMKAARKHAQEEASRRQAAKVAAGADEAQMTGKVGRLLLLTDGKATPKEVVESKSLSEWWQLLRAPVLTLCVWVVLFVLFDVVGPLMSLVGALMVAALVIGHMWKLRHIYLRLVSPETGFVSKGLSFLSGSGSRSQEVSPTPSYDQQMPMPYGEPQMVPPAPPGYYWNEQVQQYLPLPPQGGYQP